MYTPYPYVNAAAESLFLATAGTGTEGNASGIGVGRGDRESAWNHGGHEEHRCGQR
jgi:hypothetical protein